MVPGKGNPKKAMTVGALRRLRCAIGAKMVALQICWFLLKNCSNHLIVNPRYFRGVMSFLRAMSIPKLRLTK